MAYKLTVGQHIESGNSSATQDKQILSGSNLVKVSIYAIPGCTFKFDSDDNIITINNTGLFNFSLPESMYETGIGIDNIKITANSLQLLAAAGAVAVIDWVSCQEENE